MEEWGKTSCKTCACNLLFIKMSLCINDNWLITDVGFLFRFGAVFFQSIDGDNGNSRDNDA